MATKAHQTGTRAVHLVCAKLIENDFTVTVNSRNADSVDILAFRDGKSYAIQVKANAKKANFWLVGPGYNKYVEDTYFYIFVNLNKKIECTEYFTMSSNDVKEKTVIEAYPKSKWYSIHRDTAIQLHNNFFFS